MQINFAARSVSCKIVYYGPGLSGKTTNIEKVHEHMPNDRKGKLTSIKTKGDRTLFFDFMLIDLGKIAGMETRFQIYTVPGQVYYNATRKLVLRGADGIVFVADSGPDRMQDNIDSWQNLQENLPENGLSIDDIPVVIQWNKRDLPGAIDVEEMNRKMNTIGAPTFEAVACEGKGVLEALKAVCGLVCKAINSKQRPTKTAAEKPAAVETAPKADAATADARSMKFQSRRMRAAAEQQTSTVVATVVEGPTEPVAAPTDANATTSPLTPQPGRTAGHSGPKVGSAEEETACSPRRALPSSADPPSSPPMRRQSAPTPPKPMTQSKKTHHLSSVAKQNKPNRTPVLAAVIMAAAAGTAAVLYVLGFFRN